jgi:membrane-anchored mycosin MYCP
MGREYGKVEVEDGRTYGAVEDYRAEELVVALGDEDLVSKALDRLHVVIGDDKEEDDRLGLALLPLGNLTDAVKPLRQDDKLMDQAIQGKRRAGQPPETKLSDLDLLLSKLRMDFSSQYAGWIPEIGKNRLISPVRGLPYISGCALDDPSQVGLDDPADPELGQWPAPRPTEPGHGVRIGLLDTRLYQHPWLMGGYLAAKADLLEVPGSDDLPPLSLAGHATFVAGLILCQAPGAQLIIRPVLGPRALGQTWGVAKMMADFVGSGVDILNLSFGCYTDDGQPPLVLAKAVSLVSPEILLVAAAGNHGNIEALKRDEKVTAPWTENLTDTTPVWPAALPGVTAVGATDDRGEVADFSPKVPWVDVTAPGVNVESTYVYGDVRLVAPKGKPATFCGYARWKGTSFATATVSGAVAAHIGPDCSARQALEAVLADSEQHPKILKYEAPELATRVRRVAGQARLTM